MIKTRFSLHLLFLMLIFMGCKKNTPANQNRPLQFKTDFSSGAATRFRVQPNGAIAFEIPAEPGGNEYLWFYFEALGGNEQPLEFVLKNAAGAHQTGRRWMITHPVFSADGKTWVRAEKIRYQGGLLRSPVFRFTAPIWAETLRVAYCYPYTLADYDNFISHLNSPDLSLDQTIGQSEEGRAIPCFRLAAREADSAEEIWVVAREHPGETPASFVLEGMVQALLAHPAGMRLRDAFTFTFVPLLNVGGVEQGYYYHNARGVNLAEDWADLKSAEVRALKAALEPAARAGRLRLVVNLHASNDPRKGHFFLEMPRSRLRPSDAEFQQSLFQATDGNHPQLQGRSRVTLRDDPGITGNALYDHYGVYCLYMECNYSLGADGSAVTPTSLRDVGVGLVQGLAEVLRPE